MGQEYEINEPWQDNSYSTGSTNPPKNNRLLTALLVAVILLGEIAKFFGFISI